MSKEQTPITAEGFFKNHDFNDGRIADKNDKTIAKFDYYDLIEFAESFANLKSKAKVLEALEEKSETAESILETLNDMHSNDEISYDRYTYLFDRVASIQLDETEVEPKHKL